MHQLECGCRQCRQRAGAGSGFEVLEFGAQPALFGEQEELELAMELLEVASEEELDQFLGKVFKSVWKGVKKIAKPLGGALKAVAKTALPFVGGALGSMIPIPGVGTALGSALGRAVGNALELEFGGALSGEDELEVARRFVRVAGQAARQAGDSDGSARAMESALADALRQQLPHFRPAPAQRAGGAGIDGDSGRWQRRGNRIVLTGAGPPA